MASKNEATLSNVRSYLPKIAERMFFGGAEEKIDRLGLTVIWTELESLLTDFHLWLDNNTARRIDLRKTLDERFHSISGWKPKKFKGVDWTRCHKTTETRVCLGVEIQFSVSARSDLILIDLQYLVDEIVGGRIDVGVLVVSSTKLARFLTTRIVQYTDLLKPSNVQRRQIFHWLL